MVDIETRVLKEAKYILKNKATIRQTAKVFNVSKSTLHFDISKRLPKIHNGLYKKLKKILTLNFEQKNIRGGEATRLLYKKGSWKKYSHMLQ